MDTSKLGVLIHTHSGHKRFHKKCLSSCRELSPNKIVVAYDTRLPFGQKGDLNRVVPPVDVMSLADKWIIGDVAPRVGAWSELCMSGMLVLNMYEDIEYIFCIGGDCTITKPAGIHKIYDMMTKNNCDIIDSEYRGPDFAGTLSFLSKKDALNKILSFIYKNKNKTHTPNGKAFGNPEGRMGKAISIQGIPCVKDIDNPANAHFSFEPRGTWGDVLGFIHLHGTEKWRKGHHHNPLPREMYDSRFMNPRNYKALCHFWETGETKQLVEIGYWPKEPVDGGEYISGGMEKI